MMSRYAANIALSGHSGWYSAIGLPSPGGLDRVCRAFQEASGDSRTPFLPRRGTGFSTAEGRGGGSAAGQWGLGIPGLTGIAWVVSVGSVVGSVRIRDRTRETTERTENPQSLESPN